MGCRPAVVPGGLTVSEVWQAVEQEIWMASAREREAKEERVATAEGS